MLYIIWSIVTTIFVALWILRRKLVRAWHRFMIFIDPSFPAFRSEPELDESEDYYHRD